MAEPSTARDGGQHGGGTDADGPAAGPGARGGTGRHRQEARGTTAEGEAAGGSGGAGTTGATGRHRQVAGGAAGEDGTAGTARRSEATDATGRDRTGRSGTGGATGRDGTGNAAGRSGTGGVTGRGRGGRRAVGGARGRGGSDGPADGAVIATRALTKRYRSGQLAVDRLDLTVPAGSVFGFLGPNGSGKTTTIRMLMGLIEPTSGTAQVLGRPMPRAVRTVLPQVGALIEGPALYGFLSGRDNLLRYDSADPTADPRTRRLRVAAALDRVGLTAAAGKRAKAYSLGMKQRLGIAAALLRPRRLLVLDEPTNGLDPQGMREIRSLVRELASDGTTVFLSSHLLDEIEQVCTHAAVMAQGRLITQGPVAGLLAGARGRLVVTTPDQADAARVLKEMGVGDIVVEEDRVTGEVPRRDLAEITSTLVLMNVRVRGLTVERPSLEDTFVALTGEGFDVAG